MLHLITTAGTRIPLREGTGYVLGRGRECDVVVEDIACSRRHALVSIDETGDAFLEDLGSRNGSFLNGKPVKRRVGLQQGSRVRIGGSVFLIELREAPENTDFLETGTLAFDSPTPGVDLEGGELAHHGLQELLQMFLASRQNVAIHVALPDNNAQIDLRDGEVVAAACGGLTGFNALVKVGRANSGIFWVVQSHEECDRNVEPAKHLLVELSRCLGSATPSA